MGSHCIKTVLFIATTANKSYGNPLIKKADGTYGEAESYIKSW